MSDMNQTLSRLHLADPSTSVEMKKSACFTRFNARTPKSACFHKSLHARSAGIEWCHWKESRKKNVQTITKQQIMSCTLVYTEMAKHQWMKRQHPVSVLLWYEVSHLWQPDTLMPLKWWPAFWHLKAPHFAEFILPMLLNVILSGQPLKMPINEISPSFFTFTCSAVQGVCAKSQG